MNLNELFDSEGDVVQAELDRAVLGIMELSNSTDEQICNSMYFFCAVQSEDVMASLERVLDHARHVE